MSFGRVAIALFVLAAVLDEAGVVGGARLAWAKAVTVVLVVAVLIGLARAAVAARRLGEPLDAES